MARLLVCCLLATMVALTAALAAVACPISLWRSSISFSGTALPIEPSSTWREATGVDFGDAVVTEGVGRFYGLTGSDAAHSDFLFRPSLDPNPVSPLWSVGGISFTLTSVKVVLQSSAFLILSGKGSAIGPGIVPYAQSRWHWVFTAQQSDGVFSFSSSASALPEPAIDLLIALGLLGAAGVRRLRHRH